MTWITRSCFKTRSLLRFRVCLSAATVPSVQSSTKKQCFHSSAPKWKNPKNLARDTRVAGRKRFYKVVDVKPISPPWEEIEYGSEEGVTAPTVDNPISAGVDGTDSATNVSLEKPTKATMQKYLSPSSSKSENWYGVCLDGRLMKTPLGSTLAVPSLSLALAIASEWDAQHESIKPAQMPLMTLTCTALDQFATPAVREHTIDDLLRYLRNDTTCYWADATEDRLLHRRQSKSWDNLHKWVECKESGLGSKPAVAIGAGEGLIMSRMRKTKAYAGLPHEEELIDNARIFLQGCDAWTLVAMQSITMEAKSFLIGLAAVKGSKTIDGPVKNPFRRDAKKAVIASRVEEEFQIENWGLVEGGHDYDRLNCSIQIHSSLSLMQCLSNA
uniref:ATP synthase mitochondrial F1 complex assembly factor 2 n=1 Tax=Chaetoceros debilis TaxID=122233 RepID=A0A7S3V7X7_9STRA|mmetsp:Transcript_11072/g.16772  ORF Transcript_11072/g.16772 Transcript_11072/m.16772 type:complete len:385 (+) Transcript_11072:104-1258(+)